MSQADDIWNRACTAAGRPTRATAPGDRALADMVLVHSLAMNGGVLHAIETRSADERAAAVLGYRHFGLSTAADVLEDIAHRWGDGHLDLDDAERLEFEADERYHAVVPDDEVLVAAFQARLRAEPQEFDDVD